ncbi:hypothetical protein F5Y03DRAFT_410519 [Xylaria venustula]|nr:hypothetical protein F5Y03DRAFT_410519 [Xylaria venustula]
MHIDTRRSIDPHNQNLWPLALGLTWTLTGLAVICVAARFYLRKRFTKTWGWDDWIMLLALLLQITYQSLLTILCAPIIGKALYRLTTQDAKHINKWGGIAVVPAFLVSITARISIAIQLVLIFGTKRWFKWFMIYFTTIQTILGIVAISFIVAQIQPSSVYWETSFHGVCWGRSACNYIAITLQFLFAISDITFVLFPVLIIWKLNMRRRRKVALVLLLSMSLVTMIAALSKIVVVLVPLSGSLILGDHGLLFFDGLFVVIINLASASEQCLVMMIGCIPTLYLLTKLRFPYFQHIGASIVNLVPSFLRRGNSKGMHTDSYPVDASNCDNLGLGPKVQASEDGNTDWYDGGPIHHCTSR